VPGTSEIVGRLEAVLTVIYLVFNEGYLATRGGSLVRTDLCAEAIRLGRLVITLMEPQAPPEARALVALMLLHDARRDARLDSSGELVVLEQQDRGRWNHQQIAEAVQLLKDMPRGPAGPFALQAAIGAVHCQAERAEDTNWAEIVRLYNRLGHVQPSPIISLNRAVAVAMAEGPRSGLAAMDELAASSDLDEYHLLHAARADLLRRLGSREEAAKSYRRALRAVKNESERRFLERRLREVQSPPDVS
jgi:RNA polymerase sigma-70 factor (ECF subfamily)